MSAKQIVETYFSHFAAKDWAAARAILDDDVAFVGPMDRFSRADDLSNAQQRLGPIFDRVEVLDVIADGDSVCVLWNMVTSTTIGTARIAQWFHVSRGKIDRIQLFFDPRPFAALFAAQ